MGRVIHSPIAHATQPLLRSTFSQRIAIEKGRGGGESTLKQSELWKGEGSGSPNFFFGGIKTQGNGQHKKMKHKAEK